MGKVEARPDIKLETKQSQNQVSSQSLVFKHFNKAPLKLIKGQTGCVHCIGLKMKPQLQPSSWYKMSKFNSHAAKFFVEIYKIRNKCNTLFIHSPSSLSLCNSCSLVGSAYIPAATAFRMTHPWWGANTCA